MSKYCPFCDDVKDSELDTPEKFKEHLEKEHGDKIIEAGNPVDLDRGESHEKKAIPAEFREVKEN